MAAETSEIPSGPLCSCVLQCLLLVRLVGVVFPFLNLHHDHAECRTSQRYGDVIGALFPGLFVRRTYVLSEPMFKASAGAARTALIHVSLVCHSLRGW